MAPAQGGGELYFEAVYRDKTVKFYPLALPPGEHHVFRTLAAKEALSDVSVKVEIPRPRQVRTVKPVLGDAIEIPFDAGNAHRFLVHLEVVHGRARRTAKIQIETGG